MSHLSSSPRWRSRMRAAAPAALAIAVLGAIAAGPAQAIPPGPCDGPCPKAWTTSPPDTNYTPFCGYYYYKNIPALWVQECLYASSVTGGAWVLSSVNVRIKPGYGSKREITGRTQTVVSGRVQPGRDCGKYLLKARETAWCTEKGRGHFVPDGGYAYGHGWVKDLSSRLSIWAGSGPVYRP